MLKNLILLVLFSLSLNANSILTNYRLHGVHDIEKQMDLELGDVKYWNEYLANIDTTFGYIESYSSVITCNKEKSELTLYKQTKNKKFELIKNFNAFTGEMKGDKKKEGDLKTPLGIYNLTKKITKLDSFYGPMAFVTSYPNLYDTFRGKDGYGIWIHGLPTEQERDEYTKGCIAIDNSNIESLDRHINIEKTMLIIDNDNVQQEIKKEVLAKILSNLYEWRYSWIYNDINKYLSFYSKDFIRNDGMEYERFTKYKTRIFNKDERKKIIFSNINVIPYPNSKNIYQITFKEYYTSSSFQFEGDKVLMVKVNEGDKFQIFTEK